VIIVVPFADDRENLVLGQRFEVAVDGTNDPSGQVRMFPLPVLHETQHLVGLALPWPISRIADASPTASVIDS